MKSTVNWARNEFSCHCTHMPTTTTTMTAASINPSRISFYRRQNRRPSFISRSRFATKQRCNSEVPTPMHTFEIRFLSLRVEHSTGSTSERRRHRMQAARSQSGHRCGSRRCVDRANHPFKLVPSTTTAHIFDAHRAALRTQSTGQQTVCQTSRHRHVD